MAWTEEHYKNHRAAMAAFNAKKRKPISFCKCGTPLSKRTYTRCHKCAMATNTGPNNPAWEGGKTPPQTRIRNSAASKAWKRAVLERDERRCVFCGATSKRMHTDHIKEFAKYPELRLELSNGRTLCPKCHWLRHRKPPKQLEMVHFGKKRVQHRIYKYGKHHHNYLGNKPVSELINK